MPESYPSRWFMGPPISATDGLVEALQMAVYVLEGNGCKGTAERLKEAVKKAEGHRLPQVKFENPGTPEAVRVD